MSDYYKPARPLDRGIAAAIDFLGAAALIVLSYLVGWAGIGMLLATAYLLLRDGADGRSFGKRVRNLCTVNLDDQAPATWKDSVLRNLTVAIPILGYLILGVETYLAFFRNRDYRRFGDLFAHTMVVDEASLSDEEDET